MYVNDHLYLKMACVAKISYKLILKHELLISDDLTINLWSCIEACYIYSIHLSVLSDSVQFGAMFWGIW